MRRHSLKPYKPVLHTDSFTDSPAKRNQTMNECMNKLYQMNNGT